jgi:hypothetical protein
MTNEQKIQRLLDLKDLISSLEKEKKSIEEEFKTVGSFQTTNFDVAVSETTRFYMKGVDAVMNVFGELALIQNDLVSKSTFKTVKVTHKKAA